MTGGAGFIGSQTCKVLAEYGYLPVVADNLTTGLQHNVKWGPLHVIDVRDRYKLNEVFRKNEFLAVMHFAASAYVYESMLFPGRYYDNNVGGMTSLLDTMTEFGVENFVFSSSCATYGNPKVEKINESTFQNPINTYGESKLMGELIVKRLASLGNLRHATLRYFNVAGADLDLELGEEHNPEPHVIPSIINSVFQNKVFNIFGDNHETADGTCVRDYIHVWDLAHAHVKALDYLFTKRVSFEVNLGGGKGASILQLVKSFKELGYEVKYDFKPSRVGDPPYLVADVEKAQALLGWRPEHSEIYSILSSSIDWHKKRFLN